jgi:tripartite-type tricarboxylate transporter receptor subunit TctC
MRYLRRTVLGLGAAALVASAVPVGPARADAVSDFYKDKTLTILLGHPPGGSYDLYAQLAALHLGKYIPGEPKIIVEHRPGGGGGLAAAYLFSKAPTDGSLIALLPETLAGVQLLDPRRGRWDMRKVRYIGSFSASNSAYGVRKGAPATTIEAMKTTPVNVGCTGRTSASAQTPAVARNLGGLKFNMICGYRGSAAYMLALARGEVDMIVMNWATWNAKLSDQLKSGEYKLVAQTGLERNADLPDVPLIQELVGDDKTGAVFRFLAGGDSIGRALFGAPGMPDDRVAALRTAFDKMVKDPAFIADAKKRHAPLQPKPGAQLDPYVDAVLKTPPEVVELARKGMSGYQVNCPGCGKGKKK